MWLDEHTHERGSRRGLERPPRACSHARKVGAMGKVIRRLRKFPLVCFLSSLPRDGRKRAACPVSGPRAMLGIVF